ncbi:MAG: transglycosylase SLT domain-containing protein, partial [Nitrospinota bacterium]
DSTRMYQEAVKLSNNHKDNRYLRWRIGRLAYKREDYQAALNQFLNFQTEDDQTKYSDRFLYWGYKSALHSGLDAKAQSIKNRLIKEYPYNYYGTIVQGDKFNLQNSAQIQSARYKDRVNLDRVAKKSKLTDEESYHYRRLKLLKSLNMIDEALLEADRLSSLLDLKVEAEALFLSVIYNELGAYLQSFKSQHKISKSQLARHSADSLLWQLNYPLPYLELISKKAEEYNVNPFLILAIIKQESGFNSLAKSRSSALGLMQIMPETGKKLHKQVNMEEPKFSLYNSDLLYHPAVNITFGIALISQLLKKYDNNIVYALAAYNAGEPALQKWLKYNKHLPDDQFVEEISYNETKKYIKRVIENMAIYHLIYKRDFGKE